MYCPQCLIEYRGSFTECPNCHVPLSGASKAPAEWTVVLETTDRILLAMAKGLIDDAGIPLLVQGQIATLIQYLNGFLRKPVRLQVPRDREAEARKVLEPILRPILLEADLED